MTSLQVRTNEYWKVHRDLSRERGPASSYLCEGGCQGRAAEWANVHGTKEYVPLCIPCHRRYDRSTTCRYGHNVEKFGRTPVGTCRVCSRLDSAHRQGTRNMCATCGLKNCRC